MRRSYFAVPVLFALGLHAQQPLPREIVYGGDASFAPYEFLDEKGEPAGLNVDLIRAIGRARGIQVSVRLLVWHRVRAGILDGSIDVASMYRFSTRALDVDYAIPHELIYHEMFIRPGGPAVHSLDELAGKRVLVENDALTAAALSDMGLRKNLELVASEPAALEALARGQGDVAIVSQAAARPFTTRSEYSGRLQPTGPPVLLTEYAFVTAHHRRALIELLNQSVVELKANGEYQRIFDRWLRPDPSAHRVRLYAGAAVTLLALALLILYWNRFLRRRVDRQTQVIHDLDSANRQLVALQEDVTRANKELEAFSYSVSHDLRAPLRAIDGYARILVEDYESALDAEGKRVCSVICDNVRGMGQLIDDLLNFSRLSRAALNPSPIDMRALAAQVFHSLHPAAHLRFDLGALPPALGDPRLLTQVWFNLLSNAVKFSARRDAPEIRVSGQSTPSEIIYSVADNGAGFDMQYASKLFGVFQRLHSAQEFEGTGVGLAIVQRIVERHGGRVWAEGEVGRGATFSFALPKPEAGPPAPPNS